MTIFILLAWLAFVAIFVTERRQVLLGAHFILTKVFRTGMFEHCPTCLSLHTEL